MNIIKARSPLRLQEHNHELKEDIITLKKLGILIDADEEGYLLQIFTKPLKIDLHCFLKSFREWHKGIWSW